ncbi:MAG: hypothetical protein HLUCCO16_02170 [Phormidium sp. OSCR]|nr:MAG: hypothetical protein HLUCCO16_02170 [Phormidium sp. OSCR]
MVNCSDYVLKGFDIWLSQTSIHLNGDAIADLGCRLKLWKNRVHFLGHIAP